MLAPWASAPLGARPWAARAGVVTSYNGQIIDKVPPELPTRLAMSLAGLLSGMDAIGVPRDEALKATRNTALGCVPQPRMTALLLLYDKRTLVTRDVARGMRSATNTAKRVLEELLMHGLVGRTSPGPGHPDSWSLADWARERLDAIDIKSDTHFRISHEGSEPPVENPEHGTGDDEPAPDEESLVQLAIEWGEGQR